MYIHVCMPCMGVHVVVMVLKCLLLTSFWMGTAIYYVLAVSMSEECTCICSEWSPTQLYPDSEKGVVCL